MKQRNEIEIIFKRVMISDLLIAAITLVDRIEKHPQWKGQRAGRFDLLANLERAVARSIVDGEDLHFVIVRKASGYAGKDSFKRTFGVIRHHEHEHAIFFLVGHSGAPPEVTRPSVTDLRINSEIYAGTLQPEKRLKPQHIAHIVKPGLFLCQPFCSAQGAFREAVAAMRAMDQLDALADAGEDHGVFTDDVAGADREQ